MSEATAPQTETPAFCAGIDYFGSPLGPVRCPGRHAGHPGGGRGHRRQRRPCRHLPDPAGGGCPALSDPAGLRGQGLRPSRGLRLQRRGPRRADHARPHQHRHRGGSPRPGLLQLHVPGYLPGGHGHPHGGGHAPALPRARGAARASVRRHPRHPGPRRPPGSGPTLRHGRRPALPGQAVPGDHGRRRHGRALPALGHDALPHRLPAVDQLPPGAGLERLQPGAPRHGLHLGQRAHGRLLARPWLRAR